MSPPLPVLAGPVRSETVVERSRFVATLHPAADADEADAVVAAVRRELSGAGHHATATVLGPHGALERSSDDGEPAGTAGGPALAALRGAGITDVVAVVSRWFGGVLLGTGGLVRAYGGAVAGALAEADVVQRAWRDLVVLEAGPADGGRAEAELRRRTGAPEDVVWSGSGWRAVVTVAVGGGDALSGELSAAGVPHRLEVLDRVLRPVARTPRPAPTP